MQLEILKYLHDIQDSIQSIDEYLVSERKLSIFQSLIRKRQIQGFRSF